MQVFSYILNSCWTVSSDVMGGKLTDRSPWLLLIGYAMLTECWTTPLYACVIFSFNSRKYSHVLGSQSFYLRDNPSPPMPCCSGCLSYTERCLAGNHFFSFKRAPGSAYHHARGSDWVLKEYMVFADVGSGIIIGTISQGICGFLFLFVPQWIKGGRNDHAIISKSVCHEHLPYCFIWRWSLCKRKNKLRCKWSLEDFKER